MAGNRSFPTELPKASRVSINAGQHPGSNSLLAYRNPANPPEAGFLCMEPKRFFMSLPMRS